MGKKKRGYTAEPKEPSRLDRLFGNRAFAVAAGLLVVAVFAGLAVLVVTWLGGDELSADDVVLEPTDVVAPAVYERSAIADFFEVKTWDEMTDDEREDAETEIRRVFDDSTFRASNDVIAAIDVFRTGGDTLFSRQYIATETPAGDPVLAETMYFHCSIEGTRVTYRIIVTPVESLLSDDIDEDVAQPAWGAILDGTDFSQARDLGFRVSETTGRRLHGLELPFALEPADVTRGRPTEYWFDAETAQLAERGLVSEGETAAGDKANWYTLIYDQPPPVIIPSTIEEPACVEEILAKLPF